jgi:hypothetical protein
MKEALAAKAEIRAARQRQDELFYELLAQVTNKLSGNYKDLTKSAHPELGTNRIQNVRYGRPRDLDTLVKIVKASIPDFAIAEKYLIVTAPKQGCNTLIAA